MSIRGGFPLGRRRFWIHGSVRMSPPVYVQPPIPRFFRLTAFSAPYAPSSIRAYRCGAYSCFAVSLRPGLTRLIGSKFVARLGPAPVIQRWPLGSSRARAALNAARSAGFVGAQLAARPPFAQLGVDMT